MEPALFDQRVNLRNLVRLANFASTRIRLRSSKLLSHCSNWLRFVNSLHPIF